ncbi:MAG: cation:proton antiporter [Chthoniobacteraceae bacterium]
MTALAILLLVAAVALGIARRLRLPTIPVLLGSGFALSFFGHEEHRSELAATLELGLMFLVFAAGVELTPHRIARQLRPSIWVAVALFVLAGGSGFVLSRLLGFSSLEALYLALAMSTSSTLVAVRELRKRQQVFEPFARLVVGVQLLQDLLMTVAVVVLMRVGLGGGAVAISLGLTIALGALAVVFQRWVLPWLIIKQRLDEEALLLTILATLFIFVGLASLMKLPVVAGAFLGGFALSSFPLSGLVRGQLTTLSDFFTALFFTALGASVVLPEGPLLFKTIALAVFFLIVTPIIVTIVAEACGFTSRTAIDTGLLLAQTGEFSLIIAVSGLYVGQISEDLFSVIALLAVITMTLTPLVASNRLARWLLHHHPGRSRASAEVSAQGHILMLGFGAAGMWILKPLRAAGHDVLVVDDDPIVIGQLRKSGIACHRGDASDERVLAQVGAREARLIIASMRRVADAETVLRHVQGVPVITRVFEERDARRITDLGGTAILNPEGAITAFMEWFEKSKIARASGQVLASDDVNGSSTSQT